jgi:dTDP-glucose 4,6-dehydratase
MKLLITGGAGFIGSNFIRWVLASHADVVVVNFDKLTYAGNLANVKDIEHDPRYSFIRGDICDAQALDAVFPGVDVVVNFAAESHVDRSILDPEAFLRTDVMGTFQILEALRRHSTKRFIHISTDEVYGDLETGAASETHPLNPSSPYSAAKAGAELLVRSYMRTYRVPALITHFSNVYGPYQYPEKLIPLFITNLIEGKPVPVYGDGQQVREWIYIDDVSRGLWAVITGGKVGESYNIGSGEHVTNLEVTKQLLQLLKKDDSSITHVADRAGHDRRYALDSSKMMHELAWEPQVTCAQGIAKTVAWYQDNADWWRHIKSGEYQNYYNKQYAKR